MTYRPYPNTDRALRQLHRHYPGTPVMRLPECLRPMAESFDRLRANTRRAAEQGFGMTSGEYRLSTRPRIVSDGS